MDYLACMTKETRRGQRKRDSHRFPTHPEPTFRIPLEIQSGINQGKRPGSLIIVYIRCPFVPSRKTKQYFGIVCLVRLFYEIPFRCYVFMIRSISLVLALCHALINIHGILTEQRGRHKDDCVTARIEYIMAQPWANIISIMTQRRRLFGESLEKLLLMPCQETQIQ